MKAWLLMIVLVFLVLSPLGCSNESTTSGPVTIPVKLTVSVSSPMCPTSGAMVNVLNYSPTDPAVYLQAKTDNSGYAEFNTDFDVVLPNHIYKFKVQDIYGLKQATPDQDTVWVPSSPNYPDHYEFYRPISMMPK